ncbi:MAG: hypothetical protein NVSMB6_12170 [Burkholderiaceae bacterium]
MNIEINNRHVANPTLGLHQTRCNGTIIKNTETLAMRGMRVMRTPRQIYRDAVRERGTARCDGSTCGSTRALYHRVRPRKTNGFLLR